MIARRRRLSLLVTLVASSTAFSVVDDDGEGAWPAAGETLPPVAAKHKAAYDAALHRRQLIIGGNTAPQWQHTHQILLTSSENIAYTRFKCGGSLLAANIVLTAAHCFNGLGVTDYRGNPVDYWIHAHRWHLPSGSEEDPACSATIKVARVIRHELYDPDTDENDVAILHLEERAPCVVDDTGRTDMVELDDCYQKSCWKGQTMIAKGWGNTAISGRYEPEYLQEVELEVQTAKYCKGAYSSYRSPSGEGITYTGGMMCTHYDHSAGERPVDTCQGDSGGPLILYRDAWSTEPPLQVGIVSWGFACASKKYPGVFTRVGYYKDWIERAAAIAPPSPPPPPTPPPRPPSTRPQSPWPHTCRRRTRRTGRRPS